MRDFCWSIGGTENEATLCQGILNGSYSGRYHDVGRLQKENGAGTASASTAASSADGVDLRYSKQYPGWRLCFAGVADHQRQ